MYITSDTDTGHMRWLHGDGLAAHLPSQLIRRLCDEMRRVAITPRARPKSSMPRMREELRSVAKDAANENEGHLGSWIFASLDPASIGLLKNRSLRMEHFEIKLWNDIAPHVTPAHIEAYLATGRSLWDLRLRDDRYDFPREETLAFVAPRITASDHMVALRLMTGAKHRRVSARTALIAVRALCACSPDLPDRNGLLFAPHLEARVLLRVIAGLETDYQDSWVPKTSDPAILRALDLTRTRHGRLKLRALAPDFETLITNPGPFFAALRG